MYQTKYGMDLVQWGVGANRILDTVYVDGNSGAVIAVLNREAINLMQVEHIEVAVIIVPLAIETRESGIYWVDLTPQDILNVGAGAPVFYGNPGWGSTFKVGVACP